MSKVLVVGINYRPEATGIAPYTSELAEHLVAKGHRVTVITGFPHYPSWRLEPGERRLRAVETRNGVRILRRRHYVPRSQSAIRRAAYEATFLLHGALSHPERPDLVLGVVPSLSGGVLARMFAIRARAPYAVIFQDLMAPAARQSGIGGGARVAGVTALLERWVAADASTVAVASTRFRPYLQRLGIDDSRIADLPNWSHVGSPKGDRAATRARLGWPSDATVVLHAGNMGLKQGLEQIVEAARRADLDRAPLLFVLMGEGSQRAALKAQARGIDRLRFLPFQPEDDVPDILDAADVLLVSERATVIDMSLPSKLTTYFASGRPIVAAVAPEGATSLEIALSGAGVVVPAGVPAALVDAVVRLRSDPALSGRLGAAGREYAAVALDPTAAETRIDELIDRTLERSDRRRSGPGRTEAATFDLLGVHVNAVPFASVVDRVLDAPRSGERLSLHFATVHTLVEAHDRPELRDALGHGLVEPDGMPLVWLGRALGRPVDRVCGPDFMPALLEQGIPAGRTHYLFGGAPGVPEALAARLKRNYPGLRVVGTYSPPFRPLTDAEEADIVARINAAEPDYVWIALGTPKQDLWVAAHRSKLKAPAILAVGAAFDFLSGRRSRAPRWMQRSGTEWIYRLVSEPRRLWVRYTRVNARFLRLLLEDGLARRRPG